MHGPGVFQPVRAGFYLQTQADGSAHWLAVNTGDRAMSALNVTAASPMRPGKADTAVAASRWEAVRVWPPWVYLALAAFLFCALEWWGFDRRRTE